MTGYLNGIALIIFPGQLKIFFGYPSKEVEFFLQLTELVYKMNEFHYPTAILGVGLLIVLIVKRRRLPKILGAMVVVVLGIVTVMAFDLKRVGVTVPGEVPAKLPAFHFTTLNLEAFQYIFGDAAGLVLISFTSGILTAKSFARRNQYKIDSSQELFAFGAGNLASGLGQGFPLTGADSRTAVNDAMGGKTQMVGMIAGLTMLLGLFFGTAPLSEVPSTALAAVIMVWADRLLDTSSLRDLFRTSRREFFLSTITPLGVLILGALPWVILSVALSLLWLLTVAARPHGTILGRAQGVKGFHDILDYPNARTIDGLLLFRVQGNLEFFNVDYFRECLFEAIAASKTPVEWVVLKDQFHSFIHSSHAPGLQLIRLLLRLLDELLGLALWVRHTFVQVILFLWLKGSAFVNQHSLNLRASLIENGGRFLFRRPDHAFHFLLSSLNFSEDFRRLCGQFIRHSRLFLQLRWVENIVQVSDAFTCTPILRAKSALHLL